MSVDTRNIADYCENLARTTREASRLLASAPGERRNKALAVLAQLLRSETIALFDANSRDLAAAVEFGLTAAQMDRLRLTESRLEEMAQAVVEIAALPDPIGRIIESNRRPNGLEVNKVRVPLGVILFVYESRPNVTTDAAALCIKSGNAVILRGGKEAQNSTRALGVLIRHSLAHCGLPEGAVRLVETTDRAAVGELLKLSQYIDVAIPRGGEELIRRVAAEATMPVLKHYRGVCHVYVDKDADLNTAINIIENSKCQRPSVCNAAETLLVHEAVARTHLPAVAERLRARGVELRACPRTREIVPNCMPATDDDYYAEFLDLILAVRVVRDMDQAIEHIAQYGSGHTEAIVTSNLGSARKFAALVDSAAVMVNASTRFNDGGELGLGAEIGISTDKLHARGPCGVNELTTYKYVVWGDGQVRN